MRILQFGKFHGKHSGGIETYVNTLSQYLAKSQQVVNLVASDSWSSFSQHEGNVKIVQAASLGVYFSVALCPTMPYWAYQLNQQYRFDIAQLNFPDPMSHLASLVLPKHVKRVIFWHSDVVRQKKLLMLYGPLIKHALNKADAIIVSNSIPSSFPQLYQYVKDHQKIHAIPFGIEVNPFLSPDATQVATIRQRCGNKKIIFALGRHVYYKGFEYLIEAMQYVNDAVLMLGGTGPLTESLKQKVAELNLADKITFVGRIAEQELPNYYYACDIFCMPSIEPSEAYGFVQLEAMACAKPVVCCELNNGVTFVNQHQKTGLVVPPKDPIALSQALNTLIHDDSLRQQLGSYAKERVLKEFTADIMAQKTLALYQSLLK